MRPQFNSWVGKICWRRDRLPTPVFLGFPCGSAGKESSSNVGDLMWVIPLPQEGRTHTCTHLLMGTQARVHTSPYGDTLTCAHVSLWEHTHTLSHISLWGHAHISLWGHAHVCTRLLMGTHARLLMGTHTCAHISLWGHTRLLRGRSHLLMGTHSRVHTSPYGNTHSHTSPYGDTLTCAVS